MNILLIGECYSKNLGDGVICNTVENILKKNINGEVKIYKLDLSGWSDYNKYTKLESTYNKYFTLLKKSKLLKSHKSALERTEVVISNFENYNHIKFDIAIFAGGQLFMDYFSIPIYFLVTRLSKRKIPIAFNACGMGINESRINQYVLRMAINNQAVKYISLRDNYSLFATTYLRRNGIKVYDVLDPVLSLGNFTQKKGNNSKIGLGVMNVGIIQHNGIHFKYEDALLFWARIIRKLNSMEIEWEIFTNGSEEDYKFATALADILGYDSNKVVLSRPIKPNELIENISQYSKIISFRLHSHIIAYSLGIPSIGFIWDEKVREFSKKISCEKNYFEIQKEDITNQIIERLSEVNINTSERVSILNNSEQGTVNLINKLKDYHQICR